MLQEHGIHSLSFFCVFVILAEFARSGQTELVKHALLNPGAWLRMLSEDGDIIALIDDAIERLANGEYGKCLDCGEMIAEARLKVRPYALFCVKCKSRHEEMMKNR